MKPIFGLLLLAMALSIGSASAGIDNDVKAAFDRFVAAQNAHDISAVRDSLLDSPNFLWVTRGAPVWGRDAALKRFETLFQDAWKLSPDTSNFRVITLTDTTAQLFVPIMFSIGPTGQPPSEVPFLMNQTLVKTGVGWRIASILPIPLSAPAPAPGK